VPCAAGYAWGEDGSNRCPTSYYGIDNAAACESAAAAAGKAYRKSETASYSPSGCYFDPGGNGGFAFNADAVGAGRPGTQLLCSGAAGLARPAEAPRCVDASSLLGYSRATMGPLKVLVGYHYPASGLKEALDAAHGWMRTTSLPGVESCSEGLTGVLWVLHRPLGVLIGLLPTCTTSCVHCLPHQAEADPSIA
jgi:hypothetical protein